MTYLFKSELLEDTSIPESVSELMREGGVLMISLFSGCSEGFPLVELERGGGGGGAVFLTANTCSEGSLKFGLLVLVPPPLLIRSCSFTSVEDGLDFLLFGDTAFVMGLTVIDESISLAVEESKIKHF